MCNLSGFDSKSNRLLTLEEHNNNEIELKPYKCDTCGTSYLTNWILQTHIKTMHKLFDEPVVCGIDGCDEQFVSDIKLIEHKKVYHLLNGKYVCDHSKCDYNCGNKELLNIHKKVKHSNNFGHNRQNKSNHKSVIKRQITAVNTKANDYPKDRETNEFVCHHSNCGKRFAEKIYLNNHLKRHKMVKPISKKHICHYPGCEKAFPVPFKLQSHIRTHTGEKPFECDTCGKKFPRNDNLYDHIKRRHKVLDEPKDTAIINSSLSRKKYICHYPGCDMTFPVPIKLQQHIRTHTGEKPFECNTCGKKFPRKDNLHDHINRCHKVLDEPIVCGIDDCVNQFRTELSLKTHQKMFHLLSDKFVCDYPKCDYKTRLKQSLTKHKIRIHTNERPFKCQFNGCGKAFKIERDCHLENHSTTLHTCPHEDCDRTFRLKRTMRDHVNLDHSNSWYACEWPGCDYKSKRKQKLRNHSVKHGEHTIACVWPNCDKMFKTSSALSRHLLIHKQVKNHVCHWPGCQYRCNTASNLKVHMKRHK